MNINRVEVMISLAFLAATGVQILNELGGGNGKGAKFAVIVSMTTPCVIGLVLWVLIFVFRDDLVVIFIDSTIIIEAVSKFVYLLSFNILLTVCSQYSQGIWARMISGASVQTLVLAIITYRCDWEQEAAKTIDRVKIWASTGTPKSESTKEPASLN